MVQMAILTVAVHAFWLLLVIFGALWTRGRPVWTTVHTLALVWGIMVEVGPWPCPLTVAEVHFETAAGLAACQASPFLHFMNSLVYPDLPGSIVTIAGVAVCAFNLVIYGRRIWNALGRRHVHQGA